MHRASVIRVITFLALVNSIAWGLYALEGASATVFGLPHGELLPLGMLMPALVAILFNLFVDKNSGLYHRTLENGPRIVISGYLVLTLLTAILNLLGYTNVLRSSLVRYIGNLGFVLWTLLLIHQMGQSKDDFYQSGLGLGDPDRGILIAAGAVVFFPLQAGLNKFFALGSWVGLQDAVAGIPIPGVLYPFALILYVGIVIVGSPLANIALFFGEEYAWRGYLQCELEPLGRRKGSLLIGGIWGLWHFPIFHSGNHTYPPTIIGFIFALVFFTLWGFVQSYMVLKSGSIWAAAFLHGLVNGMYAFSITYLVYPRDKLFSFGLGIFGLMMLSVIVGIFLRDPVWDQKTGEGSLCKQDQKNVNLGE